ncbi:MAG: dihydropteroate synthase [Thermoplasmata archaeon]
MSGSRPRAGADRRGLRERAGDSRSIRLGTCTIRLNVPRVMGIVNNTPDSFSGDGLSGDVDAAVARGVEMFESGADIVDVGGESTRPGAEPVPEAVEIARAVPVVEALSKIHPGRVSIDTMKPRVAASALMAGASIVNDVSGLRDPRMVETVAEHDAAVIIMHMKGDPKTMQVRPRYKDVVREISEFLQHRVAVAEAGGINPRKIMVDPGIGFGKSLQHNIEIITRLEDFKRLGKPLVIGLSRKSFIGKITGLPVDQRLSGSLAATLVAVENGADIVRVHDVAETVSALRVFLALKR